MADVRATGAGDVQLPVEHVTLSTRALRRADGGPLVIACEFISEEKLVSLIEASPGHAPVLGPKQTPDNMETARALLKYAPGLLGASCVIVGPDGGEQRPAFHTGNDPKDGSLPLRFVSDADQIRLIVTILRVCGFVGGPADDIAFRDREREGGERSSGALDTGERNGNEAGGIATWESEGGRAPADAGARG